MSHLQHINAYKEALIEKGITNPETQIDLVRTAYCCAFVRLFGDKMTPFDDRPEVMFYILSYWNETHPVNGSLVVATVKNFYLRMREGLITARGPMLLPIAQNAATQAHPDYFNIDGYDQLVQTLHQEATHKYTEIRG